MEIEEKGKDYLVLSHIGKVFDNQVRAVEDFNLSVRRYEFIALVGPSGCGKSTLLRMIAGLEEISEGELYIDGAYSNRTLAKNRDIAFVFQSYALYPHMTVKENLSFGLKIKGVDKATIERKVKEVAELLEIEQYLSRKPEALSGGQRQRVALGRAIIRDAKLFLMDEPLSNLDAKLRVQMRGEIIKLHRKLKATTIYVTHDQTEAMTMADRIVIMKKGVVQQIGTPKEIYNHPINRFVGEFIGSPSMNVEETIYDRGKLIFKGDGVWNLPEEMKKSIENYYAKPLFEEEEAEKRRETLSEKIAELKSKRKMKQADAIALSEAERACLQIDKQTETYRKILNGEPFPILFGIRPEDIELVGGDTKNALPCKILFSELLGAEYYVHVEVGDDEWIVKQSAEVFESRKDDFFALRFKPEKVHLFDLIDENQRSVLIEKTP